MIRPSIFRPATTLAALAAAALAVVAVGCGDLTGLPASLPTIPDSGVAYALNGAPPGSPTAIYLFAGTFVAADANFQFDIAFDFDSTGKIELLPVSTIASGLATAHTVALQTVDTPFDSLTRAPSSGYRADTALVVTTGTTVAIQSTDPNACSVSLTGTTLYGKLVVLNADPSTHQLLVKFVSDPNCGFRSLIPNVVPKN
jgi:hypothetical protein